MDRTIRRFVLRVLAFHLLLLVLVIATLLLAWRAVYNTARSQALDQAMRRQELLAAQTARAVQSFHDSILADLDLIRRAEETGDSPGSSTPPQQARRDPAREGRAAALLSPVLWNQLQGRITNLLLIERESLRVVTQHGIEGAPTAGAILEAAGSWLRGVHEPEVSAYLPLGNGGAVLAVPVGTGGRRLLVAVVPTHAIRARFLDDINRDPNMAAMLVDAGGRVVAAPERDLIGRSVLSEPSDPRIAAAVAANIRSNIPGTYLLDEPLRIGNTELESAVTTVQPLDVTGKRWWLVISSSMTEVETIVESFFRQALFWGGFVLVAVTAILVSTLTQIIRGRLRLERVQRDMLEQELAEARRIQLAWLPQRQGRIGGCDVAAENEPASHISGDFYNWFELPDGRVAVIIGDVTGHGMSAAFLMATTQLLVRTALLRTPDPGACLVEVNRQLCQQVFQGQFVTILIMVIDAERGTVELAAAGHPPPMVGSGGAFEPLPVQTGLVLAVDEDATFETERLSFPPGACLLLYTDGVTDVQAPDGSRFSEEGLQRSLAGQYASAAEALRAAREAVDAFRNGTELTDDLTFVVVQLVPERTEPARASSDQMVAQP